MSDSVSASVPPPSAEAQAPLLVEVDVGAPPGANYPVRSRVVLPLSVNPLPPVVAHWEPASPSDISPSDISPSDISPSDITNYAYVWYKRDPAQLLEFSRDELEKIHDIIMNYSYPCYLAGYDSVRLLPDDQKDKLLNSELVFIREKMTEAGLGHIVIIQIPRILYDLFNVYYTDRDYHFSYSDCDSLQTLYQFNLLTRRYTDSCKGFIFMLNKNIITYLNSNNYLHNIELHYHEMVDFLTRLSRIEMGIIDRDGCSRVQTLIRYKISHYSGMTEAEYSERLYLVHKTMEFEKQKSEGRINLYRAAVLRYDIVGTQSLSLNTSMFTGCMNDSNGACTFNLSFQGFAMGGEWIGKFYFQEKKIKYNIKKFLTGDNSPEDLLFFIPPIHPFLQIYCGGELFHARTKIGVNYRSTREFGIRGLACASTRYLRSAETTENLEIIYQDFKRRYDIEEWYLPNERRPLIGPSGPPGSQLPPARTFAQRLAQRFRALFAPDASQRQNPNPTDWYGMTNDARQGGGRRKSKKKYFSKKRSLRRKKSRRS